jgi:23S rRNA (pseudouridine1915-N3)-methyltransferase
VKQFIAMKFEIIFVGKTSDKNLESGIEIYLKKIGHYVSAKAIVVNALRETNPVKLKMQEGKEILKHISSGDFVVLLDEGGEQLSSIGLAKFIQKQMNRSVSKIFFVTGGAFGVDETVKERANFVWSFSKLTFTHQMIRLLLTEQLYRAMTILRGESYHHG